MTQHPTASSRRAALLLAGYVAAAFVAGGCAHPAKKSSSATDRLGAGRVSASTDPSAQGLGATATTDGQNRTPAANTTPTRTSTTQASTPSGPQIVSFTVIGKAGCGGSGPGYSSPGTVTLSWKVTGANSVALSIDNPDIVGGYQGGYGLEATETLPFGCGAEIGKTVTHKYTIVAVYPGANRARTLDISATYYG